METTIASILFYLIHGLIIAGIAGMIILIVCVVFSGAGGLEKLLRTAAFATALLIYLSGRVYGVSIPDLMKSVLEVGDPKTIALYGVALPSVSGASVA